MPLLHQTALLRNVLLPLALLFTLPILPLTSAGDPDAPCYFPNGGRAKDYFTCVLDQHIAHCCPVGWTCLSNYLCTVTHPDTANSTYPIGTAIRAACTNPYWSNGYCGDFCLESADNAKPLESCNHDETFCCASDKAKNSCDCKTGKGTFQVKPFVAHTIIHKTGDALRYTTAQSSVTKQTSNPTLAANSTASGSSATSTVEQPPQETDETSDGSGLSNKGKIGVGVGVGLGGLLAVAAVVTLVMTRKKTPEDDVFYKPNEGSGAGR